MAQVNVRLAEAEKAAWLAAARSRGMTLTGFLQTAVADAARERSSKAIARMVAMELLPEIERMLDARFDSLAQRPGPQEVRLWEPPKPFDRQCDNFDLHAIGAVCQICGGSTV